ncbi:hypothetical protein Hdeb2414_s0006g00189751 [Helianthus debilis subsp. tardiflorus]
MNVLGLVFKKGQEELIGKSNFQILMKMEECLVVVHRGREGGRSVWWLLAIIDVF